MSTADTGSTFLDDEKIVRLISVPTEMEAGVIVGALEEQHIRAAMAGLTTASFRAEAPGRIDILIAEHDLSRAAQVLETPEAEHGAVDWSQVDVGDPEDAEDAQTAESQEEAYSTSPARLVAIFLVLAAIIVFGLKVAMAWVTRR